MAKQVQLFVRLRNRPGEDLDLIQALAECPEAVRAIQDELHHLCLASRFWSALSKPFTSYKPLKQVLEACRKGKFGNGTEKAFYEHGKEEGIVALGIAAYNDLKLIAEVDALSDTELIEFAKAVKPLSNTGKISEVQAVISKYKRKPVLSPTPVFIRPRNKYNAKRKLPTTPPEKPNTAQENKKHKLGDCLPTEPQPQTHSSSTTPLNDQNHQADMLNNWEETDWNMTGRPLEYGDLSSASWDLEESFLEGRPLVYSELR